MLDLSNPIVAVVTIASFLSALATLIRLTRALVRVAARLDEAMPVLLDIAEQFPAETLAALTGRLEELHGYSHAARHELINELLTIDLRLGRLEDSAGIERGK